MKIIRKNKINKIAKLIACITYIAQEDLVNTDLQQQLEYMTKIIENCADLANEIGGTDMMLRVQYFKDLLSDRNKSISN